jgi:hypothetical protein
MEEGGKVATSTFDPAGPGVVVADEQTALTPWLI